MIANSLPHKELDDSSMSSTPLEKEPVMECPLLLTTLSGVTFKVSLSVAKFDRFADLEDQVMDYLASVTDLKVFGCVIDFPRRVGFWSTTDRQQQHVLRVDTQLAAQPPPQRHTDRAHHQIESALHASVQGLRALVQEIEQTVDSLPHDVQGALLTPLTDLHTQLCGLVYVAWLLSLLHPHADDYDQ